MLIRRENAVYGNRIDYVVPGGPAHLSRQLMPDDEIIEVDGRLVAPSEVPAAIVGSDQVNTSVRLLIRKSDTGLVQQVELVRVARQSMENMVRLFELLTQLKQNGHNNCEFEQQWIPDAHNKTTVLVDQVVAVISCCTYDLSADSARGPGSCTHLLLH
jgi:hypothetical protein